MLILHGSWRLVNLREIYASLQGMRRSRQPTVIDGSRLESLDTAGVMLICQKLVTDLKSVNLRNFSPHHGSLLELVKDRLTQPIELDQERCSGTLSIMGRATEQAFKHIKDLICFLGQLGCALRDALLKPKYFRAKELTVQLEAVLLNAIPVVALVSFLIGVVVAYLYALQAEKYGANIFIVDGIGLAMSRELSPILTAIIIAGRSGSAFTAQIGTMKLNEEIDAIRTLGLSPLQVLVLPRVLALMLAMPLLVFIGDLLGILGGLIIAQIFLGITPVTFIERMQQVLYVKHIFVGLSKAPVFAAFIALIACMMGLSVENNARSVGLNTTSTVVQGIVAVIILNAIFAVVLAQLGI